MTHLAVVIPVLNEVGNDDGCNFFLNNVITYSDRKLRGPAKLFLGLLAAGATGMLMSSVWNYAIATIFPMVAVPLSC
jgi:hypothetical protein